MDLQPSTQIALVPQRMSITRPSADETLHRLADWLRLDAGDGDASRDTLRMYLSNAQAFLSWCATNLIDPMTATHDQLKLYRSALVEAGYARGTINNKLGTVRRFYEAARDWGWRTDNPAACLKAKRDVTSPAERVAAKHIPNRSAFLSLYTLPDRSIVGLRDRTILRILCYGGLRVAELCALDVGDVSLGDEPQLVVRSGKGGKRRTIPLAEEDAAVIRDWLAVRAARPGESALIVALGNRARGRRLSTRGARQIVDQYLLRAGLKAAGRSCHGLRHSLATWMLDAGVPIEVISDLLGHSSVITTAIYAKVVNRRKFVPAEVFARQAA